MQVQPFQSSTPVTPNHAEWQLRHERPVEHHARNDGDGEQDTHHTQEELARQSRQHIRMQPSDKIEQPLIELRSSDRRARIGRSEEHTSELQSLMRLTYAVF